VNEGSSTLGKSRIATLVARLIFGALATYAFAVAARFAQSTPIGDALTQVALAWAERGRRVPALTTSRPRRESVARGGGKVTVVARPVHVGDRYALPTHSPVVSVLDTGSDLIVATFDEGLFHRDGQRLAPWQVGVDPRVNDVALDSTGTLYVATGGGAYRIAPGSLANRLDPGAFAAAAVWKGHAYFASRRGLSQVDGESLWTRGPAQGIGADQPAVLADCGPALCIGAVDGLWRFDGARAERASSSSDALPADWVTATAFDGGVLWAGTMGGGWARKDMAGWRRFAPDDGLPDGRVQSHGVLARSGEALFATPTGLLGVQGDAIVRFQPDRPVPTEPTALAWAAGGGAWVGGRGEVWRAETTEVRP
jgi:ligand-binding sensor domain-containing protein